jgi:hypothetical protein
MPALARFVASASFSEITIFDGGQGFVAAPRTPFHCTSRGHALGYQLEAAFEIVPALNKNTQKWKYRTDERGEKPHCQDDTRGHKQNQDVCNQLVA